MATPIVTCGDSQIDATKVHAAMDPEFEVIYSGFSLPETLKELPQLLAGKALPTSSLHTQIASNSFEQRPVAIVVGGGYDDAAFDALREACVQVVGSQKLGVAFFRTDRALTERLHQEGKGPARKSEEYGPAIAKRLKEKLVEVGVKDGLKREDVGRLFWY